MKAKVFVMPFSDNQFVWFQIEILSEANLTLDMQLIRVGNIYNQIPLLLTNQFLANKAQIVNLNVYHNIFLFYH